MEDTQHLIKPRPPVRAFAIAAVLSIVGAILLVFGLRNSLGVVLVILGALFLLLGVVLALTGITAMLRQRVTITLTEEGYELNSRHGVFQGEWEAVTRITQSKDGKHFTIHEGDEVRRHLIFAPGATLEVDEFLKDLAERLDHAKGYRDL